jgi:hypothetical protein
MKLTTHYNNNLIQRFTIHGNIPPCPQMLSKHDAIRHFTFTFTIGISITAYIKRKTTS